MIADTAFLLIVVAFLSSIKIGIKTDRVFSRLLFLCVTAVCYIFYRHSDDAVEQTFSFVWNSSPSGNIMVDIISVCWQSAIMRCFAMKSGAEFSTRLFCLI